MTLYQANDSTGFSDSYAVPAGGSDVIFTGSVGLLLTIGSTQQVFGTHCFKMYPCHGTTKALFSIAE